MHVYGAAGLGFKTCVEETLRIVERCALEKVDLDMIMEGSHSHNIPVLRPNGRVPFPFFDSARSGIPDQFSQLLKQLAAPIAKIVDVFGNLL